MQFGVYTLDLYCDKKVSSKHDYLHQTPTQFISELGSVCRTLAKKAGWKINTGETLCPSCHKLLKENKNVTK
jgi:hypothetical protein